MGSHKLLLAWPSAAGGSTREQPELGLSELGLSNRVRHEDFCVMDQVLRAWTTSRVDQTVVVLREEDQKLRDVCEAWPVHVVGVPRTTVDMKETVLVGIQYLRKHFTPSLDERCFVAPADLPGLSSAVIDRIATTSSSPVQVVVPYFGEKQGHPVLLPWNILQRADTLGPDEGINALVERHAQICIRFAADQRVRDVDTPAEFEEEMRLAQKRMEGPQKLG